MAVGKTASSPKPESYSRLQKVLHWGVVVLVAGQFLLFGSMGRNFRELMQTGEPDYTLVSVGHIVCGVLVLTAMAARLTLRLVHGVPALPEAPPAWAGMLSQLIHIALYALLFALPLTGLLTWFGAIAWLAELHEILTTVLLWVVGLHVVGALVHQFWWKDKLIGRMI